MVRVHVIDVTPEGFGERLIAAYLLGDGEDSVLVETGPRSSAERLIEELRSLGARPRYVVVTHIHLDHAGAVGVLARELGSTIVVHPRGYRHLVDPRRLWSASRAVLGPVAEIYGPPVPVPEEKLIAAGDGTLIGLPGGRLRVVHTPGHASHHMSLLLEPDGILFTGDAAGVSIEINGRRVRLPTTPPPVKVELYIESVQRMAELRPARVAPTHYGIDPLPGTDYLSDHLLQFREWVEAVLDLYKRGVRDPEEAARLLAERLPDARAAAESGNTIIYETFYKSTIMGLLDYARKKMGDS